MKLPGLVINFQRRCVDIEATVCHAALLLLGANNGNPAMSKPVDAQGERWVHLPPRGDPVGVYLVFEDKDGKMIEHPISDFVARPEKRPDEFAGDEGRGDEEEGKFPNTFLFAGSQLRHNGPGPRTYLADVSGSVISIVTFGDELPCLPGMHSKDNEALMWQIGATTLPKVGSKVTLRLRPRVKAASTTPKASPKD